MSVHSRIFLYQTLFIHPFMIHQNVQYISVTNDIYLLQVEPEGTTQLPAANRTLFLEKVRRILRSFGLPTKLEHIICRIYHLYIEVEIRLCCFFIKLGYCEIMLHFFPSFWHRSGIASEFLIHLHDMMYCSCTPCVIDWNKWKSEEAISGEYGGWGRTFQLSVSMSIWPAL